MKTNVKSSETTTTTKSAASSVSGKSKTPEIQKKEAAPELAVGERDVDSMSKIMGGGTSMPSAISPPDVSGNGNNTIASIQAKLTVGAPDDHYEKEADNMADKVMLMEHNSPAVQQSAGQQVQTKALGSQVTPLVQRQEEEDTVQPMEEEEAQPTVQRKSDGSFSAPSSLESGLSGSSGGSSMPESTQQKMESGFGADFSSVKIHTDSNAVQMNKDIGAKAFTHGSDIYFNEGNYNPDSGSGQHLLAHELTHTIQQGGSPVKAKTGLYYNKGPPLGESVQRQLDETAEPSAELKEGNDPSRAPPEGDGPAMDGSESSTNALVASVVGNTDQPQSESGPGSGCPDLVEPAVQWLQGNSSDKEKADPEQESFISSLLDFAPSAILAPLTWFGAGVMWIWRQIPEDTRISIIDTFLDTAITGVGSMPEIMPTDKYSKVVMVSFLKKLKTIDPKERLLIVEKMGTMLLGGDVTFFWGALKGLVAGFFMDGLVGLVQMVIDIICLIPMIVEWIGFVIDFMGDAADELLAAIDSIGELAKSLADAVGGLFDDMMEMFSDPAKLFALLSKIDEMFEEIAGKVGETAADTMIAIWNTPPETLGFIIGRIIGILLFEVVLALVMAAISFYAGGAGGVGSAAVSAGKVALKVIMKMLTKAFKLIKPIIKFLLPQIKKIKTLIGGLGKVLPTNMAKVNGTLQKVLDKFDDVFKKLLKKLDNPKKKPDIDAPTKPKGDLDGPNGRKPKPDNDPDGKKPKDGDNDNDAADKAKWNTFKAEVKAAIAKYAQKGVSKLKLNDVVDDIKDRYNKPGKKIIFSHDIDRKKDEGYWEVQAKRTVATPQVELGEVLMDEDARRKEAKEIIKERIRKLKDDEINVEGIEKNLKLDRIKKDFKFTKLYVRYDKDENDYDIIGSMSPETEIASVDSEWPTGTKTDPIPIRSFRKVASYPKIEVTKVVSGKTVKEEKTVDEGIDLPHYGKGANQVITISPTNIRPIGPMKKVKDRGTENNKTNVGKRLRKNSDVRVFDSTGNISGGAYQIDHGSELRMSGKDNFDNLWPARNAVNSGFNAKFNQVVKYQNGATAKTSSVSFLNGKFFQIYDVVNTPSSSGKHGTSHKDPINRGKAAGGIPKRIQPKLKVGPSNDKYEQEADSMADKVMSMSEPAVQRKCSACEKEKVQRTEEEVQPKSLSATITPLVQRMKEESLYGDNTFYSNSSLPVQRKCAACDKEEVQRKEETGSFDSSNSLSQGLSTSRGRGSPMSESTQSFMSDRFGADFNSVRIHTDSNAVQMSRDINAKAFTHGSDIYFNSGQYSPDTSSGQHLLAHELTHTIQQGATPAASSVQTKKANVSQCTSVNVLQRAPGAGKTPWENFTDAITAMKAKVASGGISKLKLDGQIKVLKRRHKTTLEPYTIAPVANKGYWDVSLKETAASPAKSFEILINGQDRWAMGKAEVVRVLNALSPAQRNKASIDRELATLKTNFKFDRLETILRDVDKRERPGWRIPAGMSGLKNRSVIEIDDMSKVKDGLSASQALNIKWYKPKHRYKKVVLKERIRSQRNHQMSSTAVLNYGVGKKVRIGIDMSNLVIPGMVLTRKKSKRSGTPQKTYRNALNNCGFNWARKDADHVLDLGFGGKDDYDNLWPLVSSVNRRAYNRKYYMNYRMIIKKNDKESELRPISELYGKRFKVDGYFKTIPTPYPLGGIQRKPLNKEGLHKNKEPATKGKLQRKINQRGPPKGMVQRVELKPCKKSKKEEEQNKAAEKKHKGRKKKSLMDRIKAIQKKIKAKLEAFKKKVKELVRKAKKRFKEILKGNKTQFPGRGVIAAAGRAALIIIKILGKTIIENTLQLLISGVQKKVDKAIADFTNQLKGDNDKLFATLRKVESFFEQIRNKFQQGVDSILNKIIGPFKAYMDKVQKIGSILSKINKVITAVRWMYRILACVSPPAVGCLWILVQEIGEIILAKMVESCKFKEKIMPEVKKLDFVQDLSVHLAKTISGKLKEVLPAPLQPFLPEIKKGDVKIPDFKCRTKLSAAQLAFLELQKKLTEQQILALKELMEKAGINEKVPFNMRAAQKLIKAVQSSGLTPEQLQELAKNLDKAQLGTKKGDIKQLLESLKKGVGRRQQDGSGPAQTITKKKMGAFGREVKRKIKLFGAHVKSTSTLFLRTSKSKNIVLKPGASVRGTMLFKIKGQLFGAPATAHVQSDGSLVIPAGKRIFNAQGVYMKRRTTKVTYKAGVKWVQLKLKVGASNDKYEQEADAMADKVMASDSAVQRKCSACEKEQLQRVPVEETESIFNGNAIEERGPPPVQASANGPPRNNVNIDSQLNASKGEGSPMGESTQSFMGDRFGTDFSGVRIHTGANAVQMSQDINAKAFTNGSDIYFNSGQYNPESDSGKHLLAHELTHTVQQGAVKSGNSNTVQTKIQRAEEKKDDYNGAVELKQSKSEAKSAIDPKPAKQAKKEAIKGDLKEKKAAEQKVKKALGEKDKEAKGKDEKAPPVPGEKLKEKAAEKPKAKGAKTSAKGKVGRDLDKASAGVCGKAAQQSETLANNEKKHDTADQKQTQTDSAVVPPALEGQSKSNAEQVDGLDKVPAPKPDKAKAKAELDKAISESVPKDLDQINEFKEKGKGKVVGSKVMKQVKTDTDAVATSYGPMKTEQPAKPEVKKPELLPEPEIAIETPILDMGKGAVPAVDKSHTDLSKFEKESDDALKKEGIKEEQLEMVDEGELLEAKKSRKDVKGKAKKEPGKLKEFANQQVLKVETDMQAEEQKKKGEMRGKRDKDLQATRKKQEKTKTELEKKREGVTKKVNAIYKKAKDTVTKKLDGLEKKSMAAFDLGQARATSHFEYEVNRDVNTFKKKRYSGFWGPAKWLKDKFFGIDEFPEVVRAFDNAKRNFVKNIDKLIIKITKDNEATIKDCRETIKGARTEIKKFVDGLGPDLKQAGQTALKDMKKKLDALDKDIDKKKEELAKKLCDKKDQAIKDIDKKIEKMKAAMSGLVNQFLNFLVGAMLKFFKWVLKKMGFNEAQLMKIIDKGPKVIKKIVLDPIGFFKNVGSAVGKGFKQFRTNIKKHLLGGLMGWLTGQMSEGGLELPKKWDLKGFFSVVLQVMGLTWTNIRIRLVKRLGEKTVARAEKTVDIVKRLVKEGPIALWNMIKEKAASIKQTIMEGIRNWVIVNVVKAGITKLLSMLNPAGAIIQAIIAIYNVIMFFVENWDRIVNLVKTIFGGIAEIAMGQLGKAATFVEKVMAQTIPIILAFIARLLGLSGIGKAVQGVMKKVQKPVNKVLDKAIDFIATKGKKLLGKGKAAVKKGIQKLFQWWNMKKGFKSKDGKNHKLEFKKKGGRFQLFRSSIPRYIGDYLKDKTAEVQQAVKDNVPNAASYSFAIKRANKWFAEMHPFIIRKRSKGGEKDKYFSPQEGEKVRGLMWKISEELAKIPDDLKNADAGSIVVPDTRITYGKTMKIPFKSVDQNQNVSNKESKDGTSVEADTLTFRSSKHSGGSASNPSALYQDLINNGRGVVMGHLLNHQLYGSGTDSRNLAPIPATVNSKMESKVEGIAKTLVLSKRKVMYYKVSFGYGRNVPSPLPKGRIEADYKVPKSIDARLYQKDLKPKYQSLKGHDLNVKKADYASYTKGKLIAKYVEGNLPLPEAGAGKSASGILSRIIGNMDKRLKANPNLLWGDFAKANDFDKTKMGTKIPDFEKVKAEVQKEYYVKQKKLLSTDFEEYRAELERLINLTPAFKTAIEQKKTALSVAKLNEDQLKQVVAQIFNKSGVAKAVELFRLRAYKAYVKEIDTIYNINSKTFNAPPILTQAELDFMKKLYDEFSVKFSAAKKGQNVTGANTQNVDPYLNRINKLAKDVGTKKELDIPDKLRAIRADAVKNKVNAEEMKLIDQGIARLNNRVNPEETAMQGWIGAVNEFNSANPKNNSITWESFYDSKKAVLGELTPKQNHVGKGLFRYIKPPPPPPEPIQPKLNIGPSNDKYEQEADHMADKVVNSWESNATVSESSGGAVQTKPLADAITPLQRMPEEEAQLKCAACEKESIQRMEEEEAQPKCAECEEKAQPKPVSNTSKRVAGTSVEQGVKSSKGNGSSMSSGVKGFMENGFGADFSSVKIHTDSQSASMNKSIGAQAFTVGNDIYFNSGKYSPETKKGKLLLAHELTHTIQQKGSGKQSVNAKRIQRKDEIISYQQINWGHFKGKVPKGEDHGAAVASKMKEIDWSKVGKKTTTTELKEKCKEGDIETPKTEAIIHYDPDQMKTEALMVLNKSWKKPWITDKKLQEAKCKADFVKPCELALDKAIRAVPGRVNDKVAKCQSTFKTKGSEAKKACKDGIVAPCLKQVESEPVTYKGVTATDAKGCKTTIADKCFEVVMAGVKPSFNNDKGKVEATKPEQCAKEYKTAVRKLMMDAMFHFVDFEVGVKGKIKMNKVAECEKLLLEPCKKEYIPAFSKFLLRHEQGHFDFTLLHAKRAEKSLEKFAKLLKGKGVGCTKEEAIKNAESALVKRQSLKKLKEKWAEFKKELQKVQDAYDLSTKHGARIVYQRVQNAELDKKLKELGVKK
jgi:hypothetical protein